MLSGAVLSFLVVLAASAQAPIASPEVHADRTVTFRFKDSGATAVTVGVEGFDSKPMVKGTDGVWTYTTPPLVPDLYGYSFSVDGETRLDPHNPVTKPNLIWPSNVVLVPGTPAEPWEVQDVPHGVVHHHYYTSRLIGDQRDYFVYTPPGYQPGGRTKYPVLYLLHGYSDTAIGWSEVGKANLILDNLIAQKKAKPMLVVMPLGYGVPDFASANRGFREPGIVQRNFDNFRTALLTEVLPQVEKSYGVLADRQHRAIAGLSMGGAETLYVGLNNLDKFSYVGAFSSGGLSANFDQTFPGLSGETANKQLRLLWVSCGTEDGLIAFNRQLVTWLKGKKVELTNVEMPGRHTWMVWRRNLATFASKLFQ